MSADKPKNWHSPESLDYFQRVWEAHCAKLDAEWAKLSTKEKEVLIYFHFALVETG